MPTRWIIPGVEWAGADPPGIGNGQRRSAPDVAELEQRLRRLDRSVQVASMRLYGDEIYEYRRLRALGITTRRPTHYSKTAAFRTTVRKTTPEAEGAARQRISRFCGQVIGVR
jgi:hypothetical protein